MKGARLDQLEVMADAFAAAGRGAAASAIRLAIAEIEYHRENRPDDTRRPDLVGRSRPHRPRRDAGGTR